jgi:hypothetical protein
MQRSRSKKKEGYFWKSSKITVSGTISLKAETASNSVTTVSVEEARIRGKEFLELKRRVGGGVERKKENDVVVRMEGDDDDDEAGEEEIAA